VDDPVELQVMRSVRVSRTHGVIETVWIKPARDRIRAALSASGQA
jgi:hypothetical protein